MGIIPEVFYNQVEDQVIDQAFENDKGQKIGAYNHKKSEEILQDKNVILISIEEYWKIHDEKRKSPISEVSEASFEDALECLPPEGWFSRDEDESFKMMEYYSGNLTSIYVRLNVSGKNRYFTFVDDANLPHQEIVQKVKDFLQNDTKS